MTVDWYEPLNAIQSKGKEADRPGSLSGLSAARKQHQGQFFTPRDVAHVMWRLVEPAMSAHCGGDNSSGALISIFDNSVGSGRLLQFANPEHHLLFGIDVDEEVINALGKTASEASFSCEFATASMENIRPKNFDVALINPPFSVHLESPLLVPYPCTSYGKFGPHTSAVSHAYSLAQAVDAAEIVVALLPSSFAAEVAAAPRKFLPPEAVTRLRALIELPAGVFREENTEVSVSLLVFSSPVQKLASAVQYFQLSHLSDTLPVLPLKLHEPLGKGRLRLSEINDEGPAITLPVTHDAAVRVCHDGRRIELKYACGLTQAKVANAILGRRIYSSSEAGIRLPKGVAFAGQGKLDVEVYLAQEDPQASFESLLNLIREAGGVPKVDSSFCSYFSRRIRQHRRAATPFRHSVFVEDGTPSDASAITGVARRSYVADPSNWGSPVVELGQEISFRRVDDKFEYRIGDDSYLMDSTALYENFSINNGAAESGWQTIYEGMEHAFPHEATRIRRRAVTLGIDKWLSWGFQLDDLIELVLKPHGAIAAWEMGLGKARLAVALLVLNSCAHGLIVTEAGLIEEMVIELKALPIDQDSWQTIEEPSQLTTLRRINLISYERLRMEIGNPMRCARKRNDFKRSRDTYAGRLRRRIGVLVCDEGDVLSNPSSDQSRALWQLSAKRRYVLAGTPIANYPRDILPLLAFAGGDGTAAQPWSWYRGRLEKSWLDSMEYAARGVDAFRDSFVTLDWVTKEFEDTMISGAKREIPRIRNIEVYRQMLAPHVKRRLDCEPEVRKWVQIPKGERSVVNVDWDTPHLSFYLKVCDEFRSWYSATTGSSKNSNLIAILAHLRAVSFASDFPQYGVDGMGSYASATSKQRWVVDELERLVANQRKTIVYVENPGLIELLGKQLTARGLDCLPFHGGIPIKKRTKELNRRFRFGDCPILLASLGVTQKGLNIWQANEVLILSRSWSATVEEQAIKRVLRPQQKGKVRIRYIHLPGGIDIYKSQLVDFKRDSANAGLDWGAPEKGDIEFLHFDTIIARFVKDMAKMHNMATADLKKFLKSLSELEAMSA